MTEAKHTPGPWEVGDHRQIWAGDAPIAEIIPNPPMLENEANSRLIAAAPGMLEALKELLCEWDQRQEFSLQDNSEYLPDTTGIVWARQSVALATGMEE